MWDGNAIYYKGKASYQIKEDLERYTELIKENRPDYIIETGTGDGGTALYLQDVCDSIGNGIVIGTEDSLNDYFDLSGSVMAILDSDVYNKEHMAKEIKRFSKIVTSGQAMIVCHTNRDDWGSKPALEDFLNSNNDFAIISDNNETLNTYLIKL